jgi:protein O-mannosyl-transferase
MIVHEKEPSRAEAVSRSSVPFWAQRFCSPLYLALLLAVVTLAVYWPVHGHDFVNYDDADYASANPHVQSGLKWANVVWALKTGFASNWHPLTWCSHMLDWQLFGNSPGAFHLVNVLFHSANAVLLFLLLRRMTSALWRSLVVAALFALHPVHVESVAWISERKDVLSTLFFLLTLWAYVEYADRRGTESPKAEAPNQKAPSPKSTHHAARLTPPAPAPTEPQAKASPLPYYFLALLLFALGLMSKPMLVTLPFVLLLLDYWPLRRLHLSTINFPLSTLLEKLPFLALCVASSIVTYIVQHEGGAVSTQLPLGGRVANALVSYVRYVGKMLWPENLSVLYPHPGYWPWKPVLGSALLLLVITVAVLFFARRKAYLATGWFWFLGTLVPVIGLVQVGIQCMADRYTYIPLIGLFIILVWGVSDARPPRPCRGPVLTGLASLALVASAVLTLQQEQYWRDSEALFTRAVQVTRNNYLAYNNLGFYLSSKGRVDEAMENYRKSLDLNPNYEDALNNMGYALAGLKRYQEAIPYYKQALRMRPKHPEVHNNLGNALSELGQVDEAMAHYRVTLDQNPEHADAHNNYGIALAMKGNLEDAIREFDAAIRFKPHYASAHSNLGNALAVQHKFAEAIVEFKESLRLNPKDAQAHNNLANVLAEQGQLDEAIVHYQKALDLNTNNPEAHFNLALSLLRQQKPNEAITHLSEALRLKPDYAAARQQLEALTGRR